MSNITYIQSGSFPEVAKAEIQATETISTLETINGEAYTLRILIEKINELVEEVNRLKNQ